jgi:undecaprenyl-diphosphatase
VVTHRVDELDGFFVALSRLGYVGAIWILLGFGAALLWRRPWIVAEVAATVWCADLIAIGIKEAFDRQRPFIDRPDPPPLLLSVLGDSFPSGHAATSFAGAAVLMRFLPGRWPVLVALAVGIAFSRVYVGVHYPSDVIAGALLGVLVATALPLLARALRRSPRSQPPG